MSPNRKIEEAVNGIVGDGQMHRVGDVATAAYGMVAGECPAAYALPPANPETARKYRTYGVLRAAWAIKTLRRAGRVVQPRRGWVCRSPAIDVRRPASRRVERDERDGQAEFATGVFDNFGGTCAVTAAAELLDAAHMIPWADCPDELKLDRRNGLLLVRPLHCLFDANYWTVGPDGRVVVTAGPVDPWIRELLRRIDGLPVRPAREPLLARALEWRREAFGRREAEVRP